MTKKQNNRIKNSIEVPFFSSVNKSTPLKDIALLLDKLEKNSIDKVPWPRFSYKPEASFTIAHSDDCLMIKYYINEKYVKADYHHTNDPVYRDSCVEFFIGFENEKNYYNFEFNCVCTCMSAFGAGKHERELLPNSIIQNIKMQTLLQKECDVARPIVSWELTAAIPVGVFYYHKLTTLRGTCCQINFFKCGDDLPEPHFLSWSNIVSPEPDFHLPEFFGEMKFV